MRRLFSTFAPGWPGVGLLLMRVVSSVALIAIGVTRLHATAVPMEIVAFLVGLALLIGLWTPIAGSLVGVFSLWSAVSHKGDLWADILLATMGATLALVGPGAWSLDARLFGWKRIDISERED